MVLCTEMLWSAAASLLLFALCHMLSWHRVFEQMFYWRSGRCSLGSCPSDSSYRMRGSTFDFKAWIRRDSSMLGSAFTIQIMLQAEVNASQDSLSFCQHCAVQSQLRCLTEHSSPFVKADLMRSMVCQVHILHLFDPLYTPVRISLRTSLLILEPVTFVLHLGMLLVLACPLQPSEWVEDDFYVPFLLWFSAATWLL